MREKCILIYAWESYTWPPCRIYAVDMNSHLNLSDNTNELIFEIQFEDEVKEDDNIRMHVIFERDYSK